MSEMIRWPAQQPSFNPFSAACAHLRDRGRSVEPSDIPGLTLVNGRELTIGQVLDVASKLP